MGIQNLIKSIGRMDVTSDEFHKLYIFVVEKYWTLENPTEQQQNRKLCMDFALKGDDWLINMTLKLGNEMLEVMEKGGARVGDFKIEGKKPCYFKIYDKPESIDHMHKMIRNTVTVKHKEMTEKEGK